jgi:hypothetical protein
MLHQLTGDRQFHNKPRTSRIIRDRLDLSIVLGDDPADDRKA